MTQILVERATIEQALEALEAGPDVDPIFAGETEDALRAALAQQAEPSGYCTLEQLVVMQRTVPSPDKIAIYTAPPKADSAQERATPVKPAPPGLVGVVPITTVSVTTQHRVLTDADLDAIRKIVREGGKE